MYIWCHNSQEKKSLKEHEFACTMTDNSTSENTVAPPVKYFIFTAFTESSPWPIVS
jgi:hypothetical protein